MADTVRDESAWQPYDYDIRFAVTREFARVLDDVSAELGVTVSFLLRESVRRGLPSLVNDLRAAKAAGYVPTAHVAGRVAEGARRVSSGEDAVAARWSRVPGMDTPEPVLLPEPEDPD